MNSGIFGILELRGRLNYFFVFKSLIESFDMNYMNAIVNWLDLLGSRWCTRYRPGSVLRPGLSGCSSPRRRAQPLHSPVSTPLFTAAQSWEYTIIQQQVCKAYKCAAAYLTMTWHLKCYVFSKSVILWVREGSGDQDSLDLHQKWNRSYGISHGF